MTEEKFYVYILQSMKDFSFYIGQSNDLDKRMSKHFDGLSKYTSSKRPWKLVYFEVFETRREVIARERQLKSWKNANRYRELISHWRNNWESTVLS